MQLYVRQFGSKEKPAIVIIHGLAGSSRDWIRTAKALSGDYCVYTPDLRNHGKSPHAEAMNYDCLTSDLLEWMDREDIPPFHLIGHSNGGKNAMHLACKHPEYLKTLTIIEMVPKPYDPNRTDEFDAMAKLEDRNVTSMEEANTWLKQEIPRKDMREYLLDSFVQDASGHYHWEMNHRLLAKHLKELRANPLERKDSFLGPTLFIRGGKSVFIKDSDTPTIKHHFPLATIELLPNSNHFPHRVDFQAFLSLVRDFIGKHEP